jgi:5-methylcytosine-specific restriction enzyme subunit McrC
VKAKVSVRFDELESVGEVVSLTTAQAKALVDTELVEARPEGEGIWRLLPRGRVGAVRIDNVQVEVTPKEKVGLVHLLFMLGYAANPGFRPDDVLGQRDDELWPALAYSLSQTVDRALSHGVVQGYQTTEEALRTIRGRIRFGDQIRARPGMLIPIEVTYDEFSVDTTENRILRAALRTMLRVPRLGLDVRRRLLHLDGRLEGVEVLPQGSVIPRWQPTRLNERYQPALRLAEIVLRHAAAKPGDAGLEVASFVVVMWKVFEDFVTVALTEALMRMPGETRAQLPAYLAGQGDWRRGKIPMNVDVAQLDAAGRPLVVFDAKYKVASVTGQYANADHYQMLAYCTALGVPRAWLVYAGGGTHARVRTIKNTSVQVVECPLDLSKSPPEVLGQVDQIARLACDFVQAPTTQEILRA